MEFIGNKRNNTKVLLFISEGRSNGLGPAIGSREGSGRSGVTFSICVVRRISGKLNLREGRLKKGVKCGVFDTPPQAHFVIE